MAFPPEFLDEVRARIRLADLIGRRVRLTKRGAEQVGLCPFHSEKTPSFTVNEDKGFYHCFGCAAHGSHFDFVMRTEGLSFPEAVERLAGEAGVAIPVASPEARAREAHRASLHEVMERAAAWFADRLRAPEGLAARQYLEARGLTEATIVEFGLGLAPAGRTALKQAMLAAGIDEPRLIEAGLLIAPEDGTASFDRFRDRIMFPIADARGRIIAFGGRALGEARAKYLNSPETPLFHKGRVLYNLARARAAAREAGTVLVAEGYMDVIALHQAGFPHAVAPLGTALGEDQIGLLWRLAPEPVLCLDGDAAGRRAAERAAQRALPLLKAGHSLRFAFLPWGEDPDSLVREQGAPALAELVATATPLSEVLWRQATSEDAFETPERRAALRATLDELSARIADSVVRGYYRDFFQARLGDLFGRRRGGAGRSRSIGRPARARLPRSHGLGAGAQASPAARERLLVATLINHPGLVPHLAEELAGVRFVTPELDSVASALLEVAASEHSLDLAEVSNHLSERGLGGVVERLADARLGVLEPWARPNTDDAQAERCWRHVLALHHLLAVVLTAERRAAVSALAEDMTEAGLARLRAMQAQWEAGEGSEADIEAAAARMGASA